MAVKRNIDFKANPNATATNALSVRPDNCGCHKTVCDYEVELDSAVSEINLDGDYDTHELDLPNAPYAVDADGAAALEADLKVLLDGIAESVEVVWTDDVTDTLTITILGSSVEFKDAGGADVFVKTNCRASGGADSV